MVKLGKFVERDKVSHMRDALAIMNQQAHEVREKRRLFELNVALQENSIATLLRAVESGQATDLLPSELVTYGPAKAYNRRDLYPPVTGGLDVQREAAVAKGARLRKDIERSIYQKQLEMKASRDAMAAESQARLRVGTLDGCTDGSD